MAGMKRDSMSNDAIAINVNKMCTNTISTSLFDMNAIFFFRILSHFCVVESVFLMRRLRLTWSCASSPKNSPSPTSRS